MAEGDARGALALAQAAARAAEAMMAEEMKSVTGGLPLPPGFKLPF
jgi:DNA-binding protein YbaB